MVVGVLDEHVEHYPSIANCLSRHSDFGLSAESARAQVDGISREASNWWTVFAAEGGANSTIDKVAPAFAIADAFEPTESHPQPLKLFHNKSPAITAAGLLLHYRGSAVRALHGRAAL